MENKIRIIIIISMMYGLALNGQPVALDPANPHFSLGQLDCTLITIMLTIALSCFLVSELTRNYSQVDKLWSLMPIIYGLVAFSSDPSPRLAIMCVLLAIWGFRLSFNFYRKGGYNIIPWKGEEDYRWKVVQQHPVLKGRIRFGLFNLFFISLYQHFLILLFSSPLLLAAKNQTSNLTFLDIIAAFLMLVFIAIETIADNQLYRFHKLKRQQEKPEGLYSKSLGKGFMSEGLWRFVRHPNFTSEQAIWISFYFFGVAASGNWINWTLAGPLLLVLLFLGSSEMTERISSGKYPDYAAYRKDVPKFLPDIFRTR
jgi:steroid 5-alpha reductase family enzyme